MRKRGGGRVNGKEFIKNEKQIDSYEKYRGKKFKRTLTAVKYMFRTLGCNWLKKASVREDIKKTHERHHDRI